MVINKCLNQVSTQNLVSVSMYPNMLVISLSLALYHPKHNSNSTQIQLNFNSKQLQPEKCDQSFFCLNFPSKHPRFLKIYSIAFLHFPQTTLDFSKSTRLHFLLKNHHTENSSKSTQNGFVDNRVIHRSK